MGPLRPTLHRATSPPPLRVRPRGLRAIALSSRLAVQCINRSLASASSSSSSSPSPADDPLVPSPVPPSPFFLEPTHFHSTLPPSALKQAVAATLTKCGGTLGAFDEAACTWSVSRIVNNRRIEMAVQIFSSAAGSGGPLVVEVARRRGDAFDFDSFYSAVVAELSALRALSSRTGGIASVKIPLRRVPSREALASPTAIMTVDTLAPLLGMLKAPFVDVQSEAARETANLAVDARNHAAIVDSGVAARLIELIESRETDVHRCALVALAQLALNARCAEMLRQDAVLAALAAVAQSETIAATEAGKIVQRVTERA